DISGLYYMVNSDSDVALDVNGLASAPIENSFVSLCGELLCCIESVNSDDYVEAVSPVIYNNEFSMLSIRFSRRYPDGIVTSVIPMNDNSISKTILNLSQDDKITPLYPVDENCLYNDDGSAKSEIIEQLYQGSYYVGNTIIIKSDYDSYLEPIELPFSENLYGYMLIDAAQQTHFTDFIEFK
ncbi:MAG TPA: hypothetical protein VHP81_03695, partial [Lachnospiraceae bacterium]|nr:hypothetical protein [Lachnospiraceae bacterium]